MSPEPELRHYDKNFITSAIIKVDFPMIAELTEGKPPILIQKAVAEKYPILETFRGKEIQIEVVKEDIVFSPEKEIQWRFSNKDKTKIILVNAGYVILELKKFKSYTNFIDDFKFIYEFLLATYPIKLLTRIGVRYVNQISIKTGNPFEWDTLIRPHLLTSLTYFKEKNGLIRDMHSVEFNIEDYHLRLMYGMFNSEYPNQISKKEFILDFDCFFEDEIETNDTIDLVEKFNNIIYNNFEDSINDGLRELMGE